MCGVTQKISSYICGVAELCLLPRVIIYKHSSVDVASTLEVNHVKSECYVIDSCDYIYLLYLSLIT